MKGAQQVFATAMKTDRHLTDKTGTLTTGVMAVRELWGEDHRTVLATATACCDAELGPDGRSGTGDPPRSRFWWRRLSAES